MFYIPVVGGENNLIVGRWLVGGRFGLGRGRGMYSPLIITET
jgi:hypothetical protein